MTMFKEIEKTRKTIGSVREEISSLSIERDKAKAGFCKLASGGLEKGDEKKAALAVIREKDKVLHNKSVLLDIALNNYSAAIFNAVNPAVEKVMASYKGKAIGDKRCAVIAAEIAREAGLENDEDIRISCYTGREYNFDEYKTIRIRAYSRSVNLSMEDITWRITDNEARNMVIFHEARTFDNSPKKMQAMHEAIVKEGLKLSKMVQEYNEACGTLEMYKIKIGSHLDNCINANSQF